MTNDLRALVDAAVLARLALAHASETDGQYTEAYEQLNAAIPKARAALDAQAGMVMVPQDPTPGMIEAGIMFGTSPNKACMIYQSMVNAAAAAPAGPVVAQGEARCAECDARLEDVRPGKHQHPTCSQQPPASVAVENRE